MADAQKRPMTLFGAKKKSVASQIYTVPNKTTVVKPVAPTRPALVTKPSSSLKYGKNGLPKAMHASPKPESVSRSTSRQNSSEPRGSTPRTKATRPKRASPIVTTPKFDSDDDDEEEDQARRKRARSDKDFEHDSHRVIRDTAAFALNGEERIPRIIHAADIANPNTMHNDHYQYAEHFTALQEDEEECPTIHLEYPSAILAERYQLVVPTDKQDFRPLAEIADNMKVVAEHYLDEDSAKDIQEPGFAGSGLVGQLEKAARDSQRAGAQQRFISAVDSYNKLIRRKRADGTIAKALDTMPQIPPALVHHIVKDQIYARCVSPNVDIVRQYASFSDNVYGELKPPFLDKIFAQTRLRSNQVFVDLGSGVGNCVLQAALQVGCESWGCESMENPAKLATAQAKEFPARCRMWGIKPGKVRLFHDNFLANPHIREVLKRADVVLVNNQAFTSELNDSLKYVFLDLKEGAQIVSLKYFRDPLHRVKETNINDPVNILQVQEFDRWSNMVSWADNDGKWYIHTKDKTELESVQRRIEGKA